ncbi:hypothetical protein LGL55_15690 [Clostridium tagluense]|nr:hypothetical protein [Clostridium tagluense]MCB2322284.1 hypothetical protein [Clostridium tagluense]MCB2365653.1 hypothetical protein [Clostridium tagluense]
MKGYCIKQKCLLFGFRITGSKILALIKKFLKAGILEKGKFIETTEGG